MSLWTLVLPPGKSTVYELQQAPDVVQYVHLTNVALGPNPAPGSNCITVAVSGAEVALATLDKERHPQASLDLVLDQTIEFKNVSQDRVCIDWRPAPA